MWKEATDTGLNDCESRRPVRLFHVGSGPEPDRKVPTRNSLGSQENPGDQRNAGISELNIRYSLVFHWPYRNRMTVDMRSPAWSDASLDWQGSLVSSYMVFSSGGILFRSLFFGFIL
jgi:hypothetical protein